AQLRGDLLRELGGVGVAAVLGARIDLAVVDGRQILPPDQHVFCVDLVTVLRAREDLLASDVDRGRAGGAGPRPGLYGRDARDRWFVELALALVASDGEHDQGAK